MKRRLSFLPFLLLGLSVLMAAAPFPALAQEMHEAAAAAKLSDHLEIRGLNGATMTLTPADLKVLPHKSVTVVNAHSNKSETYSGVPLADLLGKVNTPLGEQLRGKLFLMGIVAEGADGYKVLYSLAEVDPRMHTGDVIVADTMDGAPLGRNGAFQLIDTEDKRPARWVRNLVRIVVLPVVTM